MIIDKNRTNIVLCTALVAFSGCVALGFRHEAPAKDTPSGEWKFYGGSTEGTHYSQLEQITPGNVSNLKLAWRFETGIGGLQNTPLMANGRLYITSPKQDVMALDPSTGREMWKFTPTGSGMQPVRGLTLWQMRGERRLFTSYGTFLAALDPSNGRPVKTFGVNGRVDLRQGLDRDPEQMSTFLTSPGVIFNDTIIVGFRTSESRPAAPGAIRAYDVRTGKLRWKFDIVPKAGEPGSETWPAETIGRAGGANNWAGMVVDDKRGIVFVPTGSPVDDFYGADRKGNNLFSNSLIALDARTGSRIWHFQGVHHDIWDRDFPTPPVLLTVRRAGKTYDAVAQGSKQGFIFLFDRATGKPLFPIEERPVEASDVPGEWSAPTQPFPLLPAPVSRQRLGEDMLTTRTPAAHAAAVAAFRTFVSRGPYTPFRVGQQTINFPGFDGGMEWGGPAVDPRKGIMFVNANDIAWTGGLIKTPRIASNDKGGQQFQQNCAVCHGTDRKGNPPDFPSLDNLSGRFTIAEISATILNGRGRMPGFPQITAGQRVQIANYLLGGPQPLAQVAGSEREVKAPIGDAKSAAAYTFTGYRKFLDLDGYPAVKPPWGTLSAIDMNTGRYLWKIPLGNYPELAAKGMNDTGSENYGGPIVTSTGVLFIGATVHDRKFRAFSTSSGKLLWQSDLPYAGVATPMTYQIGDRQYVVIATSGRRDPKGPQGSAYVAFALPK